MNICSRLSYCLVIALCSPLYGSNVRAQVTPDGTTNTVVDTNKNNFNINQGDRAGNNLFHSFTDFSVHNGGTASFNNAADIVNIFSRVTGGNISDINGLIRANGNPNLFLINPNGIIFGEGARLDIGGSFYASTADSILFPDNLEFSATDAQAEPLLTINAPIGLGFPDNPGDINVLGDSLGTRANNDLIDTENALRVNSSSTLGLIGGNLNLEGATLKTPGGRIELASVAGNERISFIPIDKGFSLEYKSVENFADITLSQTAAVDASGLVSGDIQIQGNNITLTEGSEIEASILSNTLTQETPGIIEINAIDTITLDGELSREGFSGIVTSQVRSEAVGNAGGIAITTGNLNLTKGGRVFSLINGEGNGGEVVITANNIKIDGENIPRFATGIASILNSEAAGNAGKITITTDSLSIANGGAVSANTRGEGNGGEVVITANNIKIDGNNIERFTGISSQVGSEALGNGGNIIITTSNLTLTNEGQIGGTTFGQGNAGDVVITANDIKIDGDSSFSSTGIGSVVVPEAVGNGGKLTIYTDSLSLINGGSIDASTFGEGNAGDLTVNATESIVISGVNEGSIRSGLYADALIGNGNGGNVNVFTNQLTVDDGGTIQAGNFDNLDFIDPGTGEPGDIKIEANSINLSNEARIEAASQAETGDTANIDLQITNEIILQNNSFISAQAFNNANGGNLTIDTNFIVAYPNGDNNIVASAEQGNGGNIDITAKSLFGIEERPNNPSTNDINASSEFGLDGVVEINTLGLEPTQGLTKLPSAFVVSQPLQGCQANRDTDNSSFINTGRGGLPPNPYESLDNSKVFDDVQLPNRWTENSVVNAPSSPAPTESVVEATTWVVNNSGKVELVADTSSTIYQCGDQVSGN